METNPDPSNMDTSSDDGSEHFIDLDPVHLEPSVDLKPMHLEPIHLEPVNLGVALFPCARCCLSRCRRVLPSVRCCPF